MTFNRIHILIFYSIWIGKIKVQLAKLTRVKDKDERSVTAKRLQNLKRATGWLLWMIITMGVLGGIWDLR